MKLLFIRNVLKCNCHSDFVLRFPYLTRDKKHLTSILFINPIWMVFKEKVVFSQLSVTFLPFVHIIIFLSLCFFFCLFSLLFLFVPCCAFNRHRIYSTCSTPLFSPVQLLHEQKNRTRAQVFFALKTILI